MYYVSAWQVIEKMKYRARTQPLSIKKTNTTHNEDVGIYVLNH